MSKLALYQKYRSTTFEEVVGQEVTVRTIKNAIRENRVGHAYLFCGPRGTGKTTMARLLAKAVNCEDPDHAPCGVCNNCRAAADGTHPDIIEINAANETSVDDIRDLIERSKLAPMFGKHKVYIIDEVHQLSSAASSALLKTLEEPPENVIFILATTDPQKLLPTIISRCQQFNFYRIRTDQIKDHLLEIAEKEGLQMDEIAAQKIAVLANGGMRDALSIMDQCAAFGGDAVREEDVNRIYGLTSLQEQLDLLNDIFNDDLVGILERVRKYEERGIDIGRMTDQLIDVLKDATVHCYAKQEDLLRVLNAEQAEQLSHGHKPSQLLKMVDILMDGKAKYKSAQSAASAFEVICLEMVAGSEEPEPKVVTVPVASTATTTSSKEKQEDAMPKEPEIAVDMIEEDRDLTAETVLGMLQICNKEDRHIDREKYEQIRNVEGPDVMKYKMMLSGVGVTASGKDIILFITPNKAMAARINSEKENKGLYEFLRDKLQIDKIPFAIDSDFYKICVNLFVKRTKDGTLPELFHVKRYAEEEVKVETPEEKAIKLFGKETVKII